MSTTILSVMLLIYRQISYMIFYLHYFGYVGGVGCVNQTQCQSFYFERAFFVT